MRVRRSAVFCPLSVPLSNDAVLCAILHRPIVLYIAKAILVAMPCITSSEECPRLPANYTKQSVDWARVRACIEEMVSAGEFVKTSGCAGCPFYPRSWDKANAKDVWPEG